MDKAISPTKICKSGLKLSCPLVDRRQEEIVKDRDNIFAAKERARQWWLQEYWRSMLSQQTCPQTQFPILSPDFPFQF